MRLSRPSILFISALSGAGFPLGCAPAGRSGPPASHGSSADGADRAEPQGAPQAPLAWAPFDAATFARARAEHKLVVLDGAAEWCHWCHVMEATTYHDPAVRELLSAHFIAAFVHSVA